MNNNGLPRVFVTQELPISYRKTESYGEVIFLTGKEPAQHTGSLRNAEIFAEMAKRMGDYRPGIDYLLPSGSPVAIGLGFLLAWKKGPQVRVLQWQSRDAKYNEYILDVGLLTRASGHG